jgi:hypothetical protein
VTWDEVDKAHASVNAAMGRLVEMDKLLDATWWPFWPSRAWSGWREASKAVDEALDAYQATVKAMRPSG